MQRVYLDHAATSWPKPESVLTAMDDYNRRLGAPAGRGIYREAVETERLLAEARRRVADLIGVSQPQRVLFTAGCTDGLNQAIFGLIRAGDHVITTVTEHNSVLRPLRHLAQTRDVSVSYIGCGASGIISPDDVRAAITPKTRAILLNHVSNVTGAIQPADAIGKIAAEKNVLFVLDAAQSLGHMPVSARELGAHVIVLPGHKGLLGPLGVGCMYLAAGLEEALSPLRHGGTGTRSDDDRQPPTLPDRYESGTHNVPGIIGLGAGVVYVQKTGLTAIRKQLHSLTARLLDGLAGVKGLTIYGPRNADQQLGVVSLAIKGFDPHEAAAALDGSFGIQARPGIQCAPRMHEALGTLRSGGTLRLSLGSSTTEAEVDAAIRAVGQVGASAIS